MAARAVGARTGAGSAEGYQVKQQSSGKTRAWVLRLVHYPQFTTAGGGLQHLTRQDRGGLRAAEHFPGHDGLERGFLGIAPGETAPLNRRLADAVSKAEVLAFRGKLSTILTVDHRYTRQLPVGLSGTLQLGSLGLCTPQSCLCGFGFPLGLLPGLLGIPLGFFAGLGASAGLSSAAWAKDGRSP